MEPNYPLINILFIVPPFTAYFVGILIRHEVWGNSTSSLRSQFLLGIPVSLVVVSTLLVTVMPHISNIPSYLLTLGIVMEQGMVVNETAVSHLKNLAKGSLPVTVPSNQTTAL